MEKDRLHECMGCIGRSITMRECEFAMQSVAEARRKAKKESDTTEAQLPKGFCGDVREVITPIGPIRRVPVEPPTNTQQHNSRMIYERSFGYPF